MRLALSVWAAASLEDKRRTTTSLVKLSRTATTNGYASLYIRRIATQHVPDALR